MIIIKSIKFFQFQIVTEKMLLLLANLHKKIHRLKNDLKLILVNLDVLQGYLLSNMNDDKKDDEYHKGYPGF